MNSPLKHQTTFVRSHEWKRDKYQAWIAGLEYTALPNLIPIPAKQEVILN